MATDTENTPDFGQLTDQLQKGNKQTLHYSRSRFLMTWLALGLLAILIGITMLVALRQADTNLQQTDDIARVANTTADAAVEDTDQIVAYMRGEQGIPGVPGANGVDGSPGLPGESGTPGPEGPPGDPGEIGAQGPAGSTGSIGAVGPQGPQGAFGALGPVGPTGADGAKGEKGDKGDEGARGAEGPTGPAGPPGAQGPPGDPHQLRSQIAVGQSANDTAAHKVANANCPAGTTIAGGGWANVPSDPGIVVSASSPVGTSGWSATADVLSLPPGTNWQILAFAICVGPV